MVVEKRNNVFGAVLMITNAFLIAVRSTTIKYLINQDVSYVEIFVLWQTYCFVFLSIFIIAHLTLQYYLKIDFYFADSTAHGDSQDMNNPSINNINKNGPQFDLDLDLESEYTPLKHTASVNHGITDSGDDESGDSDTDTDPDIYIDMCTCLNIDIVSYFMSLKLFPECSNYIAWCIILARGIILGLAHNLYCIALMYENSGDGMLIQSTLMTCSCIIIGILFFHEQITKIMIVGFLLVVIGLTLVIQPSFLFGSHVHQLSVVGAVYAIFTGVVYALNATMIKYTRQLNVSVESVMIAGIFVACVYSWLFMLVYYLFINDNMSLIWYQYGEHASLVNYYMVSLGLITAVCVYCKTPGYRMGDVGRLTVFRNSDILFSYILQIIFLNENDNYITYIGVAIIIIAISALFYDTKKNLNDRYRDNENENENENQNEYENV